MKKVLKWTGRIILAVLLIFILLAAKNLFKDSHRGYNLDLSLSPSGTDTVFMAGFAAFPITPVVEDTWNDVNNDARYHEKDGDSYNDINGNGKFDAWWIAGFHRNRPAQGVHDDVWARTAVFDDGSSRIAIISLDAIGVRHNDVLDIRKSIPKEAGIDYTLVMSSHTHESNDLLGIWGTGLKSGINKEIMQYTKEQAIASVMEAVERLRPAKIKLASDLHSADELVIDSRPPQVEDHGIRILQAVDTETDSTLGTLLSWGNHPETLWSRNLMISSDFPHYYRECVEKGVYDGDSLIWEGLGGTAVFINASVGGLMTTKSGTPLADPFKDTVYMEASFDKIRAQGQALAMISLNALQQENSYIYYTPISLRAKSVYLPLTNKAYLLFGSLGLLEFGMKGWFKFRTEVTAFTMGPASFISMPGEIYPELINGGVEAPEGRDFEIDPVETPPLRELMPGEIKFVLGLANDEIGYIIPKSQWDKKAPFTYGLDDEPYGQENSVGPETAPILYRELSELLKDLSR